MITIEFEEAEAVALQRILASTNKLVVGTILSIEGHGNAVEQDVDNVFRNILNVYCKIDDALK